MFCQVGGVEDLSFLIAFCFLLNEFHCSFSISYQILRYYVYYYYYILHHPLRRSRWVICVGYLGNSSTASGHSDPGGTVGPSYSLGRRDFFFFSWPLYSFPYSRLSSFYLHLFLYLISFFVFPGASVWENTRAWVPYFLFLLVLPFFRHCTYTCTKENLVRDGDASQSTR